MTQIRSQKFFQEWFLLLSKEHPSFYVLSRLSLTDSWKEMNDKAFLKEWNKVLTQEKSPFRIRSWTYSMDNIEIQWEWRIRFQKIDPQFEFLYYKQWIQLLPLWFYYFFLHPSNLSLNLKFPYKTSSALISYTEEDKIFVWKRSLISFLDTWLSSWQVIFSLCHRYSIGHEKKEVLSTQSYSLQDCINQKWDLLKYPVSFSSKPDLGENPLDMWRNSWAVQREITKFQENASNSSEWQIIQRLLKDSPELEASYHKALSDYKIWTQVDIGLRDQILKGTLRPIFS